MKGALQKSESTFKAEEWHSALNAIHSKKMLRLHLLFFDADK